jgi:hypothetical protein
VVKENIGDDHHGINAYTTYEYDIPPFDYYPDRVGWQPRFLSANHFDRGTYDPKLLNQTEFRKTNDTFLSVKNTQNTYTLLKDRVSRL